MIAPDEVTFEYLEGREFAPQGADWDKAVAYWKTLPSDEDAAYDKAITLEASELEPMITYGTNPGMGMGITDRIPTAESFTEASQKAAFEKAMTYMGLQPGQSLLGQKVDVVFIGSCTNSRISDLRLAAGMLKGRKVSESTRVMVVPGSQDVKKQAEQEGLDVIFKEAGAEWREAGCSMCIAMNGDQLQPGQYAISTSNRNFEGRQGKGGRTFLASPVTAVATAINGVVTDPRTII
jgi:3-isopropylmalate/(R)-2-methylmalate dehydratase large subunit